MVLFFQPWQSFCYNPDETFGFKRSFKNSSWVAGVFPRATRAPMKKVSITFYWSVLCASTTQKKKKTWRIRASIPVPPACEAGALPFELIPQTHLKQASCEGNNCTCVSTPRNLKLDVKFPFPCSGLPLCQNEPPCKTFHMKMSLICMKMDVQVKQIFTKIVSHKDSI